MNESMIKLKSDNKEIHWEMGESLVKKLEAEGIIKQVFPLNGMLWLKLLIITQWSSSIIRIYFFFQMRKPENDS